jgi:predicted dehydrogenase
LDNRISYIIRLHVKDWLQRSAYLHEMTAGPIRVLIVGAGDRGRQYTTQLAKLDFIAVTGVADPLKYQRERVKARARSVYDIKEYEDWRQALEDSDSYDAVFVTVLDKLHREVCSNKLKLSTC